MTSSFQQAAVLVLGGVIIGIVAGVRGSRQGIGQSRGSSTGGTDGYYSMSDCSVSEATCTYGLVTSGVESTFGDSTLTDAQKAIVYVGIPCCNHTLISGAYCVPVCLSAGVYTFVCVCAYVRAYV